MNPSIERCAGSRGSVVRQASWQKRVNTRITRNQVSGARRSLKRPGRGRIATGKQHGFSPLSVTTGFSICADEQSVIHLNLFGLNDLALEETLSRKIGNKETMHNSI
jgi:hypothetical protein